MARTRESGRDGIVGASRRAKAGRGRAPGVDALEPRKLLAAVSWDSGGGDGLWSNPLNWSGDVLPGQGDDVTIDWGAGRRVIAADQTVIRVNSLALSELLVVNRNMTLNVNEAFDIEPAGAIRINGLVNWVEGTWASDDPVAVNPGGVLNIGSSQNPASGSVTLDADLNNLGAVSWRGGGRGAERDADEPGGEGLRPFRPGRAFGQRGSRQPRPDAALGRLRHGEHDRRADDEYRSRPPAVRGPCARGWGRGDRLHQHRAHRVHGDRGDGHDHRRLDARFG